MSSAPELRQDKTGLGSLLPGSCQDNIDQRPKSLSWPYVRRRNEALLNLALRYTLHKLPNYTFRLRSETPGEKTQLRGQLSAASKSPDLFDLSPRSTKSRGTGKQS